MTAWGIRRHATTSVLFALLAVAHTWPLALTPGRRSRVDNGDYVLNAWILAWVVHQAPRDPLHLFDANIFYPEPRALAFSEHLVARAVLAAPAIWADGSAVLAHSVVMLAGFVLTAWSMAWVISRWTGDRPAGMRMMAASGEFEPIAGDGQVRVYRLLPRP